MNLEEYEKIKNRNNEIEDILRGRLDWFELDLFYEFVENELKLEAECNQ